jgi:FixJ family two-component response regulator
MTEPVPTVLIVDDDPAVREALSSLLRSVGMNVRTFASAREFLSGARSAEPSCLVLDVRLPGLSGLDLQQELRRAGEMIPIVFITGYGDIPTTVRAMKAGAMEFLPKPFSEENLLQAIRSALAHAAALRGERAELEAFRDRMALLTQREREVLARLLSGRLNKQVAADLGISEITVKVHRRRIMEKMAAHSLVDLARMTEKLRGASVSDV